MVKKGEYTVNNLYHGGYSTLDPEKYSTHGVYTGHRLAAGQLGASAGIQTANQIKEVSQLVNQGIIPIEIGVMDPKIFDQIPKQQFKEINQLAKLTGADISVHAPLIEASGISDQGWTAASRSLAEKQLKDVVERTAPLNETGGMSITIHATGAGIPGTDYAMTPEGKKEEAMTVINKETGKILSLKEELKYYPSSDLKGQIQTPSQQISIINDTEWDNSISELIHNKEDADARIHENVGKIGKELMEELYRIRDPNVIKFKLKQLDPQQRAAYDRLTAAQQFLSDTSTKLGGLFNKAYAYGSEKDKEDLKKASIEFRKDRIEGNPLNPLLGESQAIGNILETLKTTTPEIHQSVEEFGLEESSKTFANVAVDAIKKFGDKAPTLNLENWAPEMMFSSGEGLDKLIRTSREKVVKQLIEQEGYDQSAAEQQAEKVIGVTFDVGHLNMAKKKGFKDEDLMKEMEHIVKHIKHVHLTDNFGYQDSHLPPGMGNVPFKEMLERLEKEGYEGKKIVEAGEFAQQFGTSPLPYSLEAFGAPMYAGAEGPSWNQASGLIQSYSGGFGNMLPPTNYEIFGAGFSLLPSELGGSRQSAQGGRMSGKSME